MPYHRDTTHGLVRSAACSLQANSVAPRRCCAPGGGRDGCHAAAHGRDHGVGGSERPPFYRANGRPAGRGPKSNDARQSRSRQSRDHRPTPTPLPSGTPAYHPPPPLGDSTRTFSRMCRNARGGRRPPQRPPPPPIPPPHPPRTPRPSVRTPRESTSTSPSDSTRSSDAEVTLANGVAAVAAGAAVPAAAAPPPPQLLARGATSDVVRRPRRGRPWREGRRSVGPLNGNAPAASPVPAGGGWADRERRRPMPRPPHGENGPEKDADARPPPPPAPPSPAPPPPPGRGTRVRGADTEGWAVNQDRLPPPLVLPPPPVLVVLLCRVAGPPLLAVAVVAVAVEAPADRDVGSAGRDGHEGARRNVDRGHAARPPPRGLGDRGTAPPPRAEAVASLEAGTAWGPSPPAAT